MNNNEKKPKEAPANPAETKKQNQVFPNIPAAAEKQNPPDIDKKDIEKSSKINKEGKTDNTENGQ